MLKQPHFKPKSGKADADYKPCWSGMSTPPAPVSESGRRDSIGPRHHPVWGPTEERVWDTPSMKEMLERLTKEMTPEQITERERLANEFVGQTINHKQNLKCAPAQYQQSPGELL